LKTINRYWLFFGNGMATGKYTMGSIEPLGTPSDWAESALKIDSTDVTRLSKGAEELGKVAADAPKGADVAVGSKRKRSMLTEEDTLMLSSVTVAVNNVAEAIRSTKVDEVHPDLYSADLFMFGFSEEVLIVAFSHLVDNKAQGTTFVGMSHSHRVLWLRTFQDKNYYV
jgi:hypothetical protein